MENKLVRKPSVGTKLSDESFITLFMVGVLVVLFVLACLVVPNFYQTQNMINLVTNNWFYIVLGIGVTFLLITGNFDMSVGGNIAFTAVLSVYFCQAATGSPNALANGLGLPYPVPIGLALLCAMSVGALNAFFIARLKVPSIIVTLGTMMLARGAAQVITQGAQRNTSLPDVFGVLGSLGIPGTTIKLSVLVMLALVVIAFIWRSGRSSAGASTSSAQIPRRRGSRASVWNAISPCCTSSAPCWPASRASCWPPNTSRACRARPPGMSSTRW